ncbi:MAG: sigma-54 dependent transcriptional regulator [Verrucomicrobiae bacterium]|nr:sigma-54 dependent transcriptional regulator [Verrucomicrobiae bacterium]
MKPVNKNLLPPLLIVDDEQAMRISLGNILNVEGYKASSAESAEQALKLLEREEFFMVITDMRLGGMSGIELLKFIHQRWQHLPVLVITAYATPKQAVEAIKLGAYDYLAKPFDPDELINAVKNCAERYLLLEENRRYRQQTAEEFTLEHIIGESPKMLEIKELIKMVAPTDTTVLILGETGTGKELVAGAIHSLSHRRENNYVRINCAAIPENLLESELFGHEKGAFTGALRQKLGRVEEADGGTIFLDEIGDMSRPLQAKLLRFLENGTFTRVGGNEELKVNVRLIAATNRDIIEAIRNGQFREDLYHRLNVIQFRPPPLRERSSDIILLANHFLNHFTKVIGKKIKGFTDDAKQKLLSHHWPGNVRELRNVIERAVILENSEYIQKHNLPDFQLESRLRKESAPIIGGEKSLDESLSDFEKNLILQALEQNNYNIAKTADQLKISRHALRYRMQRLNLKIDGELVDEGTKISNHDEK